MPEEQDGVRRPDRYSRVDPWVISADTDAEIAFVTQVFGASETPGSRMLDAEGRIGHVEVEIGGAVITMFDAPPGVARNACASARLRERRASSLRPGCACGRVG